MTDPTEPPPAEDDVPEMPETHERHDKPDGFLAFLVELANEAGLSLGITLNVGGTVVSGQLVGRDAYFEGIATEAESATAPPGSEMPNFLADLFRRGVRPPEPDKAEQPEEEPQHEEPDPPPRYIHLKEAKFFHPGGEPMPTNRGVFWRGRLAAVDGFSIGSLGPPQRER